MRVTLRLCLIFLLEFPFSESFSGVWVASPDVSSLRFKAYVTALGGGGKTYAQDQWERLQQQTRDFRLKDKIAKAQEAYLSGDSSTGLFRSIADMAYLGDWNEEQRRVILYALLRLAQLSDTPNRKKAFLIFAGRFITEDLSAAWPEYHLFPPPLIEELNRLRGRQNSFLIHWRERFPHHEIILVNGKQVTDKTRLNEGKYRITALSSTHAPYIRILHLSELLSSGLKTEPLTEGHCGTLKMRSKWRQKGIRLFRPEDCLKEYAFQSGGPGSQNVSLNKSSWDLPHKKSGSDKPELQKFKSLKESTDDFLRETETAKEKPFKNPHLAGWFAIGTAAVALSFVILLSGKRGTKPSPEKKVFH